MFFLSFEPLGEWDEIKFGFEAGVLAGAALVTFGAFAYCELKLWRHAF